MSECQLTSVLVRFWSVWPWSIEIWIFAILTSRKRKSFAISGIRTQDVSKICWYARKVTEEWVVKVSICSQKTGQGCYKDWIKHIAPIGLSCWPSMVHYNAEGVMLFRWTTTAAFLCSQLSRSNCHDWCICNEGCVDICIEKSSFVVGCQLRLLWRSPPIFRFTLERLIWMRHTDWDQRSVKMSDLFWKNRSQTSVSKMRHNKSFEGMTWKIGAPVSFFFCSNCDGRTSFRFLGPAEHFSN